MIRTTHQSCTERPVVGQTELGPDDPADRKARRTADHLRCYVVAERKNEGKQPASQRAGNSERDYDISERVDRAGAYIGCCLDQVARNPRKRQVDRQDDERQIWPSWL